MGARPHEPLRIIAGTYRGRKLKTPPSLQTRPTSDRLRETLFNILALRIEDARFLDLCAGTGAVGIEALSRGARMITFVDQSRQMCELIEQNLAPLDVDEQVIRIITADAVAFLQKESESVRLPHRRAQPFDIVFFDPPYQADYESTLNYLGAPVHQLLSEDAIVIVEHYKKKDLAEDFGALRRYRVVKQGDSVLSFYKS